MVPLVADQEVIVNETENATLSFRIDDAAPPVLLEDLRWFYAANFSSDPSVRQDITNLASRTTSSRLTFSEFTNMRYINLIVSNITQRRSGIGGETDEGRYFLFATNPAGVAFSYIDLVVFGMYFQFLGCQTFHVCTCVVVCCLTTKSLSRNNTKWDGVDNDGVWQWVASNRLQSTGFLCNRYY